MVGLRPVPKFSLGFFAPEFGSRVAKSEKGNPINESRCQNQITPVPKSSAYDYDKGAVAQIEGTLMADLVGLPAVWPPVEPSVPAS
jgi:hypothetical protein